MLAVPLKRCATPRYPTRLAVQQDPDLLRQHLPATWGAHPELAAAAACLLAFFAQTGCTAEPDSSSPASVAPDNGTTLAAPVSDHGDTKHYLVVGQPAPPVYLSEEEAWTIIDDELAKAKIALPDRLVPLAGMQVSKRDMSYEHNDNRWTQKIANSPGTAKPFKADRGNLKRRLAVEFVLRERYAEEGGLTEEGRTTWFDFREAAQALAQKAAAESKSPTYFGALYDPATESRAESKRLLRLQVRDFIAWLQAQGAI